MIIIKIYAIIKVGHVIIMMRQHCLIGSYVCAIILGAWTKLNINVYINCREVKIMRDRATERPFKRWFIASWCQSHRGVRH